MHLNVYNADILSSISCKFRPQLVTERHTLTVKNTEYKILFNNRKLSVLHIERGVEWMRSSSTITTKSKMIA